MQAGEFNLSNTKAEFFEALYRKNPGDLVAVNLWQPASQLPVKVEPVDGKPDMFRLTPSSPFQPGRYALYLGDSLHSADQIFGTVPNREAAAWWFEIARSTPEPSNISVTLSEISDAEARNLVWVNLNTRAYYIVGSRLYGRTGNGKFMTEAAARKAGYRQAKQ